MSTTGTNLFKIYDNVEFRVALTPIDSISVRFYNTSISGTDNIERWCKANISWEEEYQEYMAQLTHYKQYYSFGFRPTISFEMKIVNSEVKEKVNSLLSLINSNRETISIIPNKNKSGAGAGKTTTFNEMRLISPINPKEISDSIRIGETLELTFESKICYQRIIVLNDTPNIIADVSGNTIVDNAGNKLLGGFL
jgi:hypothetical protein